MAFAIGQLDSGKRAREVDQKAGLDNASAAKRVAVAALGALCSAFEARRGIAVGVAGQARFALVSAGVANLDPNTASEAASEPSVFADQRLFAEAQEEVQKDPLPTSEMIESIRLASDRKRCPTKEKSKVLTFADEIQAVARYEAARRVPGTDQLSAVIDQLKQIVSTVADLRPCFAPKVKAIRRTIFIALNVIGHALLSVAKPPYSLQSIHLLTAAIAAVHIVCEEVQEYVQTMDPTIALEHLGDAVSGRRAMKSLAQAKDSAFTARASIVRQISQVASALLVHAQGQDEGAAFMHVVGEAEKILNKVTPLPTPEIFGRIRSLAQECDLSTLSEVQVLAENIKASCNGDEGIVGVGALVTMISQLQQTARDVAALSWRDGAAQIQVTHIFKSICVNLQVLHAELEVLQYGSQVPRRCELICQDVIAAIGVVCDLTDTYVKTVDPTYHSD